MNKLASSLLAATVLATASPFAVSADQPVIGLITKTDTNPFFVKMKEGATQMAKERGAKLVTAAGKQDGDNAAQVTAIENMMTAGAKTILITANDSKAIVPAIQKARAKGVMVIALDSPTDPQDATDALFATDNYKAGVLIGEYAKAALGGKPAKIVTLDLFPGHPVGAQRHNGFMKGFGLAAPDAKVNELGKSAEIVCSADSYGDQAKGQTAMENCLQKNPDVNLVYTINEPAAAGAYTALKRAGKEKGVVIVSVDGGCAGIRNVKAGVIAATSQQYPLKMAALGVAAGVDYAAKGTKVSGYTDTGVTLIADKPMPGVESKDSKVGESLCWGK
ncbi:MAG: sugar ABC transporter substrate-binding protein [Vitreoscilla sp.]